MGEALASHTFHACGCARHFKACFAHKTSDALSYSVTFVSQVPKLGIASWDNCVDFVVSRAIQSTNASPELLLPRGTSCACCPCVHGAYGSDMFEYYKNVLQLSPINGEVSLCNDGKQRRRAKCLVCHDSTAFPAVFACHSDDGASFLNLEYMMNTELQQRLMLRLVVPRALRFLHTNVSPARASL